MIVVKKKTEILWWLCLLILVGLVSVTACKVFYWKNFGTDGVLSRILEEVANGRNPYSRATLDSQIPQPYLCSGFYLNVFLAVPLLKLGATCFEALGIISVLSLALNLLLFYRLIRRVTQNSLCSILGTVLFCFCMQRETPIILRPDPQAETLILLILIFGSKALDEKSTRRRWFELILCSLFFVLIFWLKIHYCVVGIALFLAVLLKNRKTAFLYFLSCLVSFALISAILYLTVPVWVETWISFLSSASTGENGYINTQLALVFTSLMKMIIVSCLFMPMILLALHNIIRGGVKFVKRDSTEQLLILNILLNFLVLLPMGENLGTWLSYHFFLLIPTVIIIGMKEFLRIQDMRQVSNERLFSNFLLVAVLSIACVQSALSCFTINGARKFRRTHMEAYQIIDKYASDDMLLAPEVSDYAVEKGIYNFNDGDRNYVLYLNPYDGNSLQKKLTLSSRYYDQSIQYGNVIADRVSNKEYSIIVLEKGINPLEGFGSEEAFSDSLEKNYKLIETTKIYLDNTQEDVELTYFVPRGEENGDEL